MQVLTAAASFLPSSNPLTLICTCGPLCNCDAGIPEGADLLALLRCGLTRYEAELTTLSNRSSKRGADLETRIRRQKLVILHQELKAALQAELYNVA